MKSYSVRLPGSLIALAFAKGAERDWRGECYVAAFEFYMGAVRIVGHRSARLVHGTPVYMARKGGERIGHAWVEITTPDDDVVVFDLTFAPVPLPRAKFYGDGDLDAADAVVVRYTHADILARIERQMAEQSEETDFILGPWDDRVSAASHNIPGTRTLEARK